MITLDLSILNQKGTPMFNSDLFANRPAAGIVGRIFISTDTQTIFRDTGTTWDTIGGGGGGTIAGSIGTGQVAFGTAANTIGGNADFLWDNANSQLNLSTNANSATSSIRGLKIINTNSTGYANTLWANDTTDVGQFIMTGTAGAIAGTNILARQANFINAGGTGGINIYASAGNISFLAGTGSTSKMVLFQTGNLAIGSTTDTGDRLQVTGKIYSSYVTPFSGVSDGGLVLYNPTALAYASLGVSNDAHLRIKYGVRTIFQGSTGELFLSGTSITGSTNSGLLLQSAVATSTGSNGSVLIQNTVTFASIAHSYTILTLNSSITSTTANIARGLHVNPTLSAIVDFRSVEWSNNTGWGLYGVGTANNYLRGNLLIGNATPIASNIGLQVTGLGYIQDSRAYASGTIQSFVIVRDTTINTAISGSSGICNYVSTGDSVIQSSQSVPASTSFAGIYSFNKYSFSNPGLTLTATQAAGNGLRSVAQLQTQNVFRGANSGTITHVSGIQIAGFYNDNDTLITPVIPNAYQLIINDTGAYGHTFSFTNRWGIYQEGINDRNYLAGNLLLNSTTDTGQILQVNGAIRVNGQASGTAGGASGQHLIINVDGTQYKIALLNP